MLRDFNLYDLFVLSFVQLVVSTVLVLSPARDFDTRFRWTGSKMTEVILGAARSGRDPAVACVLTAAVWGLPLSGLETSAYLLTIFSIIVIVLRPDCNVVGQVFYASYAAAGFTFVAFAALVAVDATRSIQEALTSSLFLILDFAAFLVWNSNMNYVSDVLCRRRRTRPLPQADPSYQPMVSLHIPAYNEPPEILIETIKAVERIDYPNFEIVVVDNNTPDPAVYGPVEEYCRGRDRCGSSMSHPGRATRREPATSHCAVTPILGRRSSVLSTPMTSSSPTICAKRPRTSPIHNSVSFRALRETATSREVPTTQPASTRTKPSTSHRCPRATSATRCHSSARWACSAAVPSRKSAGGTNGASARTPRRHSGFQRRAGPASTCPAASAAESSHRASPGCSPSVTAGASGRCRYSACIGAASCRGTGRPTTTSQAPSAGTT